MRRVPYVQSLLLILLITPTARADTIEITAGVLTLNRRGGEVQLEGPRGFALSSIVGGSPFFGALAAPGEMVTLDTGALDFRGPVTLDGMTLLVNQPLGTTTAALSFFGSLHAPAFSGDEAVSVFAPFTFAGIIRDPGNVDSPALLLNLVGQGTAQVDLLWNALVLVWEPQRGVYRFESSDPPPIPEPATLILVGSGLAGLMGRRFGRRFRLFGGPEPPRRS